MLLHESLAQLAAESTLPLATTPANVFYDGTQHLVDKLDFNHTAIQDFMGEYAVPPENLTSALVDIRTRKGLGSCSGGISVEPAEYDGKIYFPHITLGINPRKVKPKEINSDLRHELGHLIQDARPTIYQRPALRSLARSSALGVFAYGTTLFPDMAAESQANRGIFLATLAITAFAGLMEDGGLHGLEIQEYQASWFARKHKDFNPISII